ncbi:MAG: glycosyltransferase family 2 protein [Planctomycetota bacterium]
MADAAPEVVAIVVNYKLAARTVDAVRSLLAGENGAGVAVFVLDNGGGARPDPELAALRSARVHVTATEENVGYCAGVNLGLAWAATVGAEFVLMLNNDVRTSETFLPALVRVLRNDPDVAAVAPTILWPDGRVWCQGARMRFGPNINVLLGQDGPPAPRTLGPQAVDYLPGACALYRRADLEALGGLDESYFMYMEDADLGARLRARGRKILWLPWVAVEHDASASSGGGRSPMRKFMTARNAAHYLRRHGTAKLWLAFVLFDLLSWPLSILGGTPVRAAWAKARGAWGGLLGKRVTAQDVTR